MFFMRYTIAINSYKHSEMLARCLRYAKEAMRDLDAEIIVADSETQEETSLLMREDFPEVRFFPHKKNIGMGALANIGVCEARGEYLFLINYDCIINKEAIIELAHYLKEHKEVGLIAPKVLNYDGTLQRTMFRFYDLLTVVYRRTFLGNMPFARKHLSRFTMEREDSNDILEPDWVMGSAIMVRTREIQAMGGFDPRFFMYFEDTDLCRRYWENEKKVVYFPYAQIYHFHGKGSASTNLVQSLLFNKLTWIHIFSACKYFLKYRGKSHPRKSNV